MSRWSASTFVMTATTGVSSRNERSYSSASATRYSPCPSRAFVPRMWTWPPTTIVGSKPASVRTMPVREVVVVFPWVPATAIPCLRRMISPSISARRITGMPRARAAATSVARLRDGRGDDEQVGVFDVLRVVPGRDLRPEPLQPGRVLRARQVAARDLEGRGLQEDLGDTAHPHPARPHEVEAAQPEEPHRALLEREDELGELPRRRRAWRGPSPSVPCGRAFRGPSSFSVIAPARFSAVRLCSSMRAAAPL